MPGILGILNGYVEQSCYRWWKKIQHYLWFGYLSLGDLVRRFLLSTVLRPSCSLDLVMGIHFFIWQVAEREKLHQLGELDVAREEAKFSGKLRGSGFSDWESLPDHPVFQGRLEVGEILSSNIFHFGGRSSSKNPWVNKHTQMRKVIRCLPMGFFRRKFHQTHGWNATCDVLVSCLAAFWETPAVYPLACENV